MKRLLFVLVVLIMFSCEDSYVKFDSPQPYKSQTLKSFGKSIQGRYVACNSKNIQLNIESHIIFTVQKINFKLNRLDIELDSMYQIDIQDDKKIIDYFSDNGGMASVIDDSIFVNFSQIDTMFQISENQVLKKMKGGYFLNYEKNELDWRVKRIEMKNDTLFIGEISPTDSLLRYDFIEKDTTYNKYDSSSYINFATRPSRKELKKLVNDNTFQKTKCYCKLEY